MTTTIAKPKMKIPPKIIRIQQVEGPVEDLRLVEHSTWCAAESHIRNICERMPKNILGAFKTDFTIEFVDGESYKGRLDAYHPEHPHHEGSLAAHIRSHLTFHAGLWCPAHLTEDQYQRVIDGQEKSSPGFKQQCLDFLTKYALTDEDGDPALKIPTGQTTPEGAAVIQPDSAPTATATATAAPQKSAREAHDENVAYANANKLPWLPIVGNTFPVKGLLYVLGGKWDSKTKLWSVPSHKHDEAQAATNKFTRPAKAAAPAVITPATTLSVVIDPKLTTVPSAGPVKSRPQSIANPAPATSAPITPTPAAPQVAAPMQTSADAPKPQPPAAKPVAKASKPKKVGSLLRRRLEALLTGAEAVRKDTTAGGASSELFFIIEHLKKAIDGLGE